jgi:predicted cupin superfamily sugar epimerase
LLRTGSPDHRLERELKMTSAEEIMEQLGLQPHPEGGCFRETWRGEAGARGRAVGTAIYYLLKAGEVSRWHRVDAVEAWHWYAGAPLALSVAAGGGAVERHVLGNDIAAGARPQAIVPAHAWQSAVSLGDWTLCGCTVSPGFQFDGFEMAALGWEPG